ncbi:helix-turn-helix domain-containing protein [Streptomyces canus]|uniref:helix-turn-helix domain-containing protein n=1 Tax=Streptomyces canus TaxID=58343 RepID=UPI003F4C94E0
MGAPFVIFTYSSAVPLPGFIRVQLRYAFRLHPDARRQTALARAFGCVRVVFNDAVRALEEARRAGRPFPGAGELSTRVITEAKPECRHRPRPDAPPDSVRGDPHRPGGPPSRCCPPARSSPPGLSPRTKESSWRACR